MNRTDLENICCAIKQRNRPRNLLLLFLTFGLLLSLQTASFAQKRIRTADVLLFEIEKTINPGGGGMGRRLSRSRTLFIYKSGRIACKLQGYDQRGKEIKATKTRCLQISKAKIDELTALAEQADFLDDSYRFFRGGVDYGNWFSISYFGKAASKKILLTNPRISRNELPVPESVTKFLQKIAEIDEDMEVEYELSK